MKNAKLTLTVKYAAYTLLLLILYVLQTTPGLFALFGAKPMLVVSAAIAIAMHDGEFTGGLYGAFAGLLCDMGGSMLFGFNGLFTAVFCITAGLLVIHLTYSNIGGATLFVFITMLARGGVEYLFGYGMWGYENVEKIFLYQMLPVVIYTAAVTPLMFILVRWLHRRFEKALRRE